MTGKQEVTELFPGWRYVYWPDQQECIFIATAPEVMAKQHIPTIVHDSIAELTPKYSGTVHLDARRPHAAHMMGDGAMKRESSSCAMSRAISSSVI
jgi:hypothetical protein